MRFRESFDAIFWKEAEADEEYMPLVTQLINCRWVLYAQWETLRTVVGGKGQGAWISRLRYPFFLIPVLYGNIQCNVSQFRSITVPFGGTRRLPSSAQRPSVQLPCSPSTTLKLVLMTTCTLTARTRKPFLLKFKNVTLFQLLFTGCSLCDDDDDDDKNFMQWAAVKGQL